MKQLALIFCSTMAFVSASSVGNIVINPGETIVFLGDSITNFGNYPYGYVNLVIDGLKQSGVTVNKIAAGINGDKSSDMLNRIEKDVLRHHPDWLILSCGVNDVAHGDGGVTLDNFQINVLAILAKAQENNIKVMLLTPSLCNESLDHPSNVKLEGYCIFLRKTAEKNHTLLADINKTMRDTLARMKNSTGLKLTVDNMHMNGLGNQMMAREILKAFGVEESALAAANSRWNDIPSMPPILNPWYCPDYLLSVNDWKILESEAEKHEMTVEMYVKHLVKEKISYLRGQR